MSPERKNSTLWWDLRKADFEWSIRLAERPYVARERLAYLLILGNAAGFAFVVNESIDNLPVDDAARGALFFLVFAFLGGLAGSSIALMQIANACARFSGTLRQHIFEEALSGVYRDASHVGAIHSGNHSITGIVVGVAAPLSAIGAVLAGWVQVGSPP